MDDFITAEELQDHMRQFAQFSGVQVTIPYPAAAPYQAHVAGAISIYGELKYWETELDLRSIVSGEEIGELMGAILGAFAKAAQQ